MQSLLNKIQQTKQTQIVDETPFVYAIFVLQYHKYLIILQMLPKKIKISSPHKSLSLQQKFLVDPKADFFLSCGTLILPLHWNQISSGTYFANHCSMGQRFHTVQDQLNVLTIQKVFAFFYGYDTELSSVKELQSFLDVIDFFRFQELRQGIQGNLQQLLPELDLFQILQFSYQYGLQKIFILCFKYLECEEFQQINYNKFDFLRCDFTLFQLVLRRHHVLKINGQIYGLSADTVQEVIRSYCIRSNFNHETLSKLLQKYVKSLKTHYLVKGSLRLEKLDYKEVFQSGIYDNEQGHKHKLKSQNKDKQLENEKKPELSKKKLKNRKMSCNVEYSISSELQWFRFGYDTLNKNKQSGSDEKIIIEEKDDFKDDAQSDVMVNTSISLEKSEQNHSMDSQHANSFGNFEDDDTFLGKVSTLLDHYNEQYQKHQTKFNAIKDNVRQSAQSMIFHDLESVDSPSEMFKTARFANSTKFSAFRGIL